MEKFKKITSLALMCALAAAVVLEFALCFLRGYEELWYTILVPGAIVVALAVAAYKTRFKWLYFIGTAILLGGAVLLIGFPSYVMFAALILGGLSLAAEIALLVLYIMQRRK